MLQNYFKLAVKVLSRNKFYTFVSLFGISFTLAILMLSSAFINNEFSKEAPLTELDKIQVLPFAYAMKWAREEVVTVDTVMVNGQLVVDTIKTEKILKSKLNSKLHSGLGYEVYKNNIQGIQHKEFSTAFSMNKSISLFPNNKKIQFSVSYVDEDYFNVFDFQFLEGAPFGKDAIDNSLNYAVVTHKMAKEYFGKSDRYVGKKIQHNEKQYEVVGVVREAKSSIDIVQADVFLPLTLRPPTSLNDWFVFGECAVAFKVKHKADLVGLNEELRNLEPVLLNEYSDGKNSEFDELNLVNNSIYDYYARNLMKSDMKNPSKSMFLFIGVGLFAFLLIPTINLINLNITRIMERSAEIGVRKSFGATKNNLIVQFVFENIVLTLLGGFVGLLLTLGVMSFLNTSGLVGRMHFSLNIKLFLIGLFITVLFGVLSGLFPAIKMSKISIAKAIKTNSI